MWWAALLNSIVSVLDSGGAGGGGTSYESIATATGTGSSSTITFSSIPSTYSSLQLRISGKVSGTSIDNLNIIFNSDTGTNYKDHYLMGDGSAASSGSTGNPNAIALGNALAGSNAAQTSINSAVIIDLIDYASTTKNKTLRAFFGEDINTANTNYRVTLASGLWLSTAAVSSITFTCASNFTTAASFSLYGIKGA
jgi:hypothetical protein